MAATNTVITDQPITVKKKGSNYTVRYNFSCEGKTTTKVIATKQNGDTYTFTPTTEEFAPLMPNSIYGLLTIDVLPNGTTSDYSSSTYKLAIPKDLVPKATLDSSPGNILDKGFKGKIIAGVTYTKIEMDIQNLYGASQKIEITADNGYSRTVNVEGINDNNTQRISIDLGKFYTDSGDLHVKITDSRGRTSNDFVWYNFATVYPYSGPVASVIAEWNDDNKPVITFSETHQETVAEETNTIQEFKIDTSFDDISYSQSLLSVESPFTIDKDNLDVSKNYKIQVTISDELSTLKTIITLNRQFIPVIDFGADGNTIAIFGAAPSASTEKKLIIGDTSDLHCEYQSGIFSVLVDASNPVANFEKSETNKPIVTFGTRAAGTGSVKGNYSLVNGNRGQAAGDYSYAGGYYPVAKGATSFVHGHQAETRKDNSQAFGYNTVNNSLYGMVIGRFNNYDATNALFIIGDGDSFNNRKNVFEVFRGGEATLNGKSVNSMFGGLVAHWYAGTTEAQLAETGTNNSVVTSLPFFLSNTNGPHSDFINVNTSSKKDFTVQKTGIYSIQARVGVMSTTVNKRVEIAPYVNNSRVARLAKTCCTPAVFTLTEIMNYTMVLNEGDTFSLRIAPVDSANVKCYARDILITVLDYEGKYK